MRYVDLIEIAAEATTDPETKSYCFKLTRGVASFRVYTKTLHVFEAWKEYFSYYTIQHDFEQKYHIKELYEKEKGMMYAFCGKAQNNPHKETFLAKFIEAASLADDIESVRFLNQILYEIRLSRSFSSLFFAEVANIFEHQEFLIVVYRVKYDMNLREFIVKNRSMDESQISYLFSQLVVALNDAHKASIVVRQLNPELIFINPADLHLVICDLSCGTLKSELSRPIARSCIGFIAPEIINDKPYSNKADCFSLGITAVMM